MAKKPEDRYASAGDLALAAHEALSDPDQDHAANILRRSQEATLPGPPSDGAPLTMPATAVAPRAAAPPAGHTATAAAVAAAMSRRLRASGPDRYRGSGRTLRHRAILPGRPRAARSPAPSQPAQNPPYYQGGGWGGGPPSPPPPPKPPAPSAVEPGAAAPAAAAGQTQHVADHCRRDDRAGPRRRRRGHLVGDPSRADAAEAETHRGGAAERAVAELFGHQLGDGFIEHATRKAHHRRWTPHR